MSWVMGTMDRWILRKVSCAGPGGAGVKGGIEANLHPFDAGWPHFAGLDMEGYSSRIRYVRVWTRLDRARTSYEGQCLATPRGDARNTTRRPRCRRASKPLFSLACSPLSRRAPSRKKKLSWSSPSPSWPNRLRASSDFHAGRAAPSVRHIPSAASLEAWEC